MSTFSPSATTTWKRCPVMWQLSQLGIVRRDLGKRELAAALGSAFAQAMYIYHRCRQVGAEPAGAPLDAAQGWLLAQKEAWQVEGRRLGERDTPQYESLERRLDVLVTYALSHDPLPPEWRVVAVEEPLGLEYGNARPDLVCQKPDDTLVVIDYKSTLTLGTRADERTRKLQMRLDDWRDSDQLFHYAWAVGARYETAVTHVGIVLAEVEPKPKSALHDFWVDPAQLEEWVARQRSAWVTMALHRREPGLMWRAATHADTFGRCEYYDFCYGPDATRDVEYTTRTRGL